MYPCGIPAARPETAHPSHGCQRYACEFTYSRMQITRNQFLPRVFELKMIYITGFLNVAIIIFHLDYVNEG